MKQLELVTWSMLGIILLGAVLGEYKGTTDVTKRVKTTISDAQQAGVSACDVVGHGLALNSWSNQQAAIQWRRSIIAACALGLLLYIFGLPITSTRQALLFIALTFLAFSSMSGYSDYHMRDVAVAGIDDLLTEAMVKLAPIQTCSPSLINTVTLSRKKRDQRIH